ncbi:hypothetical protein Tco_0983148, partial [Tanacetum coccineum]
MDTGCSIPIVGSISPEGFLPSILLLVVIIVTVVIVVVILIVVVVAIVGVVIVVAIIGVVVVVGGVSFIIKLLFVIIGVPVGPVFLLGLLALAIVAVCASRAAAMPSAMDNDITSFGRGYGMIYEDRDNDAIGGNDNERAINNVVEEEDGEQIHFLGGNSSLGTKKYRGSNSNDGGNTGDGVKIAGGVIGSGDEI